MYYQDLELPQRPGEWQGLEFTVQRGEVPARPPCRIEAATWGFFRARDADGPLLWAKSQTSHEGLWWLAADRARAPVVPPITAADLRGMPQEVHGRAWWAAWGRWFAEALVRSSSTPLQAGRWALAAGEHAARGRASILASPQRWRASWSSWPLSSDAFESALDPVSHRWVSWIGGAGDVVRLRAWPRPGDERVRAWAKRARDGTLPPILVMLARGMGLWLILDGHDRLRAALDEDQPVPVLHLFASEREPGSGELVTSTRAWPLPGGQEGWRADVSARLQALGLPADHALLGGLSPFEAKRLGRAFS